MSSAVRVVDHGADALLKAMLRASRPMRVRVGVIGSEAEAEHESGHQTVADIASTHEFGIGVPERSFIRDYVDENEPELARRLRAIAHAVTVQFKPPRPGLDQFGDLAVGEIQERISQGIEPPNSPETIARKQGSGSTTPLIDTGQLRSSISFVVEEGKP